MKPLFFFGSGADTDFSDRLKSGQSFSKLLLTGKYNSEAVKLIGNGFKKYQIIYSNSTKVFLQTIIANKVKARNVLDNSDVDKCIAYIYDRTVNYDKVREICKKWYSILFDDKSENEGVRNFFLENAVFFDSLDEKFNSLRNTDFDDNARRVINAYTQVFILMMKSVYQLDDDFPWDYESVFKKLKEPYEITSDEKSYYGILRKRNYNTRIVTTNYTDLASNYTGIETIHLHGKLTWFENLEKLTVFDCTCEEELKIYYDQSTTIPFILISSGVKPLICTRQIKEYSRFLEALEKSDTLLVVGYKFNSEDNHINSIIADWLRYEKSKLIYINFNESVDFSRMKWATDFSEKKIEGYDNDPLDKKINNIIVHKENSRVVFNRVLDYLEDNS